MRRFLPVLLIMIALSCSWASVLWAVTPPLLPSPYGTVVEENPTPGVVYLTVINGDTPIPNDYGIKPSNPPHEWTGSGGPLDMDNASIGDGPGNRRQLVIGGVLFERGVGTHSVATLVYDLTGADYSKFEACVGMADDEESDACEHRGSSDFTFLVDDVEVASTGTVLGYDNGENVPPVRVEFDIPLGAQELTILIDDGGDGIDCDHAGIGDAKLIASDTTITIVSTAGEGGTIEPGCADLDDCAAHVEYGGCQTLTVIPDECNEIDKVYIDGELFEDEDFLSEDEVSADSSSVDSSIDCHVGDCDINLACMDSKPRVLRVLNTFTFMNVDRDHTIHVTFKIKMFTITSWHEENGSIAPFPSVDVECGSDIEFTITPNPCREIEDVVVDGDSVGAVSKYIFKNVTRDSHIAAYFDTMFANVSASAGSGGEITPEESTIGCGSSRTFTATPYDCYRVDQITVNGTPVADSNGRYTLSLSADNMQDQFTIRATFARLGPYDITAGADSGGTISPSGTISVPCDGARTFTVVPDPGYRIENVQIDGNFANIVDEYFFQHTFGHVHGPHSIHATFRPTPEDLRLLKARFSVCERILTLSFNKPVDPDLIRFGDIGMEIDNSHNRDIQLLDNIGLTGTAGEPYVSHGKTHYPVMIDTTISLVATKSLVLSALVDHKCNRIDILLKRGTFTAKDGDKNREADERLRMSINDYLVGVVGDVTGDGEVTAYDAGLILQAVVSGMNVFPIYEAAQEASDVLAQYGLRYDVMQSIANTDGSMDGITSFDAALTLRFSAGLIDDFAAVAAAPIGRMSRRHGRVQVRDFNSQNLEVSIDLDDVSDVYSADIVMTYDPQALTVTDVARTSAVSEWLFERGAAEGQLRISLAGMSQPVEDGSLVKVSFDAVSPDAIKQLKLTEFKLNGGILKTSIENLPKAFALLQNYPNPFNPETWIPYRLSLPANVTIDIYNVTGRMVRRLELGSKMPGHYVDKSQSAYWDGKNEWGEKVSSGIYFYQLQADRDASVKKMIVVK